MKHFLFLLLFSICTKANADMLPGGSLAASSFPHGITGATTFSSGVATFSGGIAVTGNAVINLANVGNYRGSEGAGTTTLVQTDNHEQVFSLTGARTVKLPSTSVVVGETFVIENVTEGFALTVQSSGANTIATLCVGRIILVANTAAPTTAANWTIVHLVNTEFAYNTSTSTTASDTTSFANSSTGATIQSITAQLQRRIRFLAPRLTGDRVELQIKGAVDAQWYPLISKLANVGTSSNGDAIPFQTQNTTSYGMGILPNLGTASTDFDIIFGTYSSPNGATFASNGQAYSTGAGGCLWRVAKYTQVGL